MENKEGISLVKRYNLLKSERSTWEGHWSQVAEYIVPQKDDVYGHPVAGKEKFNKLYDSTAINANEQLASALHGMLTSPSSVWFGFTTGDEELDSKQEVRKHLQQRSDIMIHYLNQSNFQPEIHEVYVDLGSFGTSALRIEEDKDNVVRFTAQPIYSCVIDEDADGRVNVLGYEYQLTLEQIVEKYGEDKLDYDLMQAYHENPLQKKTVIHMVMPRSRAKSFSNINPKGMPIASYRVLECTKTILEESGFKKFPYVIPRWTKLSGEKFGRSSGMKALPDIRMVNKMKKSMIEAAQASVAPPIQVPDDGVLLPIKLEPASVNYYRAGTKDRIEPIQTGAQFNISDGMIKQTQDDIKEAFFVDQLKTVQNDRMTATEINQRRDEALRMLSPVLGRLQHELLMPLIERVHDIMDDRGLFPPLPEVLHKKALTIKYKSLIAKAQRGIEAEAFQRSFGLLAPLAQAQPQLLDYINGDALVKQAADIYGVPYQVLRSDEEVANMRKQRAQQQAQMQQMEQQANQADINQKQAAAHKAMNG